MDKNPELLYPSSLQLMTVLWISFSLRTLALIFLYFLSLCRSSGVSELAALWTVLSFNLP